MNISGNTEHQSLYSCKNALSENLLLLNKTFHPQLDYQNKTNKFIQGLAHHFGHRINISSRNIGKHKDLKELC